MLEPQLWISVLEIGSFYSLLALAYMIIRQGAGLLNFALAGYAMLAGVCAVWATTTLHLPVWPALGVGAAAGILASVATEFLVVRPMVKRTENEELPLVMAVAAVLFALEQGSGSIFGRTNMRGLRPFDFPPILVGEAVVTPTTVSLVGTTLVVFFLYSLWLHRSRTGRMLRAVGDNSEAAGVLGFPIAWIRFTAFVIAGAIVSVAGIVFAQKAGISFRSGLPWALKGFIAAVIGGSGTEWAPLVGGMVLGCADVFVPYYLGGAALDYSIFVIAVVFFIFRPQGIFAERVRA